MSRQMEKAILNMPIEEDHVDVKQQQWAKALPELDTVGMAILGRARWITRYVRPSIEAIFSAHQMDSGEFDVLATLRRHGAPYVLMPTELYRSLMISSGGLTARLKKMEAKGWVVRESNEADGRSQHVRLTPKGKQLVEALFHEDMQLEAKWLSCLNAEEQEQLAGLLRKLILGFTQSSEQSVE